MAGKSETGLVLWNSPYLRLKFAQANLTDDCRREVCFSNYKVLQSFLLSQRLQCLVLILLIPFFDAEPKIKLVH